MTAIRTAVHLTLHLPPDVAELAERVQREEPEFLSRVVQYGLARREIYRSLRERGEERGS